MSDDANNNDLKRFEFTTQVDLDRLIQNCRAHRWVSEECFPSRVLRDRPHVRLERGLLETVRTEVQSEPGLKLQDVFEDALLLWLKVREYNAAGIDLIPTPMPMNTLSI
ncbi:MAG TPA: hypothetical protein VGK82_12030 [Pyrinomonadaceae bacterium]